MSDELDVLKSVTAQFERAGIPYMVTGSMSANFYTVPRMTREERLTMGCAMRETARAFVEASIREQDPQATPEAVRNGLFLRFYGHEFDAESRAKILAAIESAGHPVAR